MLSEQYIIEVGLRREKVAAFDAYPFCLDAVRHLHTLTLHPSVTFLIGENGSGKSTLLEAIAVAAGLNPEGGSRNFSFETRASHSPLHECLRLARGIRRPRDSYFLRAESYYNVATEVERLDKIMPLLDAYGGESLHAMSHGESFMALLLHRFGGNGLYLLDEPEAALSPTRQMSMLTRMHELVKLRSQFIIATHSPIIMAYPDAFIYALESTGIRRVAYTETEHYQVTRNFLGNPDKMLDTLFGTA